MPIKTTKTKTQDKNIKAKAKVKPKTKTKAKVKTDKPLTQREKDFLKALITEPNYTKAYQSVYPSAKSPGGASASANALRAKLLKNPNAVQYMNDMATALKEKPAIASAEEVLSFLSASMRGEIMDQFGLDPSLSDRQKAAELLGKKWALFTEKLEVKAEVGLADVLHKARERALSNSNDNNDDYQPIPLDNTDTDK